jgi:hypothetical protein
MISIELVKITDHNDIHDVVVHFRHVGRCTSIATYSNASKSSAVFNCVKQILQSKFQDALFEVNNDQLTGGVYMENKLVFSGSFDNATEAEIRYELQYLLINRSI